MDVIDVDIVKLFKATGYEARTTGMFLALLEAIGCSEVPCGPEIMGEQLGTHIQSYRSQFREALGIAEPEVVYAQEEQSES